MGNMVAVAAATSRAVDDERAASVSWHQARFATLQQVGLLPVDPP
jgi:hypothetical protein